MAYIDKLPHETFDEFVEKYADMNIAHQFREGHERSMRIWLYFMLGKVVDWNSIDKDELEVMYQQVNSNTSCYIL